MEEQNSAFLQAIIDKRVGDAERLAESTPYDQLIPDLKPALVYAISDLSETGVKNIAVLLKLDPTLANQRIERDTTTPLHLAIMSNNLNAVIWLFKNSADLNATDSQGNTPLDLAKVLDRDEIIQFLTRYAQPENPLTETLRAIIHNINHSTVITRKQHEKDLETYLLSFLRRASVERGFGFPEELLQDCLLIINSSRHLQSILSQTNAEGFSLLFFLRQQGAIYRYPENLPKIALIEKLDLDYELRFAIAGGAPFLYRAIQLIQQGAAEPHPSAIDDLVDLLIDTPDLEMSERELYPFIYVLNLKTHLPHKRLLHFALVRGYLRLAEFLIEQGATLDNDPHDSPLVYHAQTPEAVRFLVAHGVDINQIYKSTRETALHVAAHRGNLELTQCLVQNGADIALRNNKYQRAIDIAEGDALTYLKEIIALQEIFQTAIETNDIATVREMVSVILAIRNSAAYSPLCHVRSVEMAQLLIEAGVRVDVPNKHSKLPHEYLDVRKDSAQEEAIRNYLITELQKQKTAFFDCVKNGDVESIETWVKNPWYLTVQNSENMSALEWAIFHEKFDTASFLLICLNKTLKGSSAFFFQLFTERKFNAILFLLQHGFVLIPDLKRSLIFIAASNPIGEHGIAQLNFIESNFGFTVNEKVDTHDRRPLHYAATAEMVEHLMALGADVFAKTTEEKTALDEMNEDDTQVAARACLSKAVDTQMFALHNFIAYDDLENVTLHFREGMDVMDLLQTAVACNAQDITEFLLSKAKFGIRTRDSFNRTVLHYNLSTEMFSWLLERGADITAKDSDGNLPLHCAASRNQLPCVRILFRRAPEQLFKKNNAKKTAFDMASDETKAFLDGMMQWHTTFFECIKADDLAKVQAIAYREFRNAEGHSPLECALYGKHLNVAYYFVATLHLSDEVFSQLKTYLLLCLENATVENGLGIPENILKSILYKMAVNAQKLQDILATKNKNGYSLYYFIRPYFDIDDDEKPLFITVAENAANSYSSLMYTDFPAIEALVKAGLNIRNEKGEKFFNSAVRHQNFHHAKFLLEHGCAFETDAITQLMVYLTVMGDELQTDRKSMLKFVVFLIEKMGLRIVNPTTEHETVWGELLLQNAFYFGNSDLAAYLIENGVKLNPQAFIMTPSRPIPLDAISYALSLGADINAHHNDGNTALHLAVMAGDLARVKCLIKNGASIYVHNKNVYKLTEIKTTEEIKNFLAEIEKKHKKFMDAVYAEKLDILQSILDEGDINLNTSFASAGIPPLDGAALFGKPASVTFLVEHGANIQRMLFVAHSVAVAEILIKHGADVHERHFNGNTTLLHVVVAPEMVRFFVAHGLDINAEDQNGNTPLHTVCHRFLGREVKATVEALCESGANLFAKNNEGQTPIDTAHKEIKDYLITQREITIQNFFRWIAEGDLDKIEQQLERGMDLTVENADGFNALSWALVHLQFDVAQIFIRKNIPIKAFIALAYDAIDTYLESEIINLLRFSFNYFAPLLQHIPALLCMAAVRGKFLVVDFLLERDSSLIDKPIVYGETLLQRAAENDDFSSVVLLAEKYGADPRTANTSNACGEYLRDLTKKRKLFLDYVLSGNTSEIERMLSAGFNASSQKMGAVWLAITLKQFDVIRIFIQHNVHMNLQEKLHLCACVALQPEYEDIVSALKADPCEDVQEFFRQIENPGETLDQPTVKEYGTLLHFAVTVDNLALVRSLLSKGASPFVRDAAGKSPLALASSDAVKTCLNEKMREHLNFFISIENGRVEEIQSFVEQGFFSSSSLNLKEQTALEVAIEHKHRFVMRYFTRCGKPISDNDKKAFFFYCVEETHLDELQKLINDGFDPNAQDWAGNTTFHYATSERVMKFLLHNHYDINATNKAGWTPLHAALWRNDHELAKLLLSHGADPRIPCPVDDGIFWDTPQLAEWVLQDPKYSVSVKNTLTAYYRDAVEFIESTSDYNTPPKKLIVARDCPIFAIPSAPTLKDLDKDFVEPSAPALALLAKNGRNKN